MDKELICTQCGSTIDLDESHQVDAGGTLLCQQCGAQVARLPEWQPVGSKPVSRGLRAYLAFCRDTGRDAAFDAARIRRFEIYLTEQGIALEEVQMGHIKNFLEWIVATDGAEFRDGFASTLTEYLTILHQSGFLPANPMAGRRPKRKPADPVSREGLSEALLAFVNHQEGIGVTDNLTFDLRRLRVWEAFLGERGKSIPMAASQDLLDFMERIDGECTPKQACGFAVSVQDLYAVLVKTGMVEKSPEPPGFEERRAMMDLILHSQEADQLSGTRLLRRHIQKLRDGRVIFFVTAALMLGFGVFLGLNLFSHKLRQYGKPEALPAMTVKTETVAPRLQEQEEKSRLEKERLEKERLEKERLEKERLE
ncbi:MAG: hypothetical protein HQL96_03675, partial [Magnetococcales bacterium]|nr:hypothetical protein [Magnetococcales bacterium]